MNHHTKDKGDLGVLKIKCDLCSKGYMILSPETEHAPFDLVAYKNKKFIKIQVKYRAVGKSGTITVSLKTCWNDKKGTHIKKYDLDEIDLVAVFCPDTNECYYFDPKETPENITLRVDSPKNNQQKNISLAKNFLSIPLSFNG